MENTNIYVFTGSSGLTPTKIGEARVYWFGLTDDTYKGDSTEWDLYLYDIQTFTKLFLTNAHNPDCCSRYILC